MTEKEFIQSKVDEIKLGMKNFPSDFLESTSSVNEFSLPGKVLIMGEELFGKYEIVTNDGDSVYQADNYSTAKYLIYASRTKPLKILIPNDEATISRVVHSYEKFLDTIVRKIQTEFHQEFPDSKNVNFVVNEIFLRANLIRS